MTQARVRYGYRKIRVLLNRKGWGVGKHLVYRLYREEGLPLRHRPPRRCKANVPRTHQPPVTGPNDAETLDFVADQLANGHQIRALTVVDVSTRESLAISGHFSTTYKSTSHDPGSRRTMPMCTPSMPR